MKAKMFKTFNLKDLQKKLLLKESKLNTPDDVRNLIENIKKYEEFLNEFENLNNLFLAEEIDKFKYLMSHTDEFKLILQKTKVIIENNASLDLFRYTRNKLNPFEKKILYKLMIKNIGLNKDIENYWYELLKSTVIKSWINYYEAKLNEKLENENNDEANNLN